MLKVSIKYGGILFISAALCALLVSSVFVIVDPIIKDRTLQKVRDNLNSIYEGQDFEYIDVSKELNISSIENADALYKVTLGDNSLDFVYQMSPEGRNDQIIFLVAYNEDRKVKKIQYVQMRETKGRGDKITRKNYLDNIYNQSANDMNVDMISGATYSSSAMKQSLEASSSHLINEVLK